MPPGELQLQSFLTPFAAMDPVNAILPVPCLLEGDVVRTPIQERDDKLTAESRETESQEQAPDGSISDELTDEVVSRGWIELETEGRADALFMISEGRLGIGRTDTADDPRWIQLADISSVDGIGEPDNVLAAVELATLSGTKFTAGWNQGFCDAVISALMATVETVVEEAGEVTEDVTSGGDADAHANAEGHVQGKAARMDLSQLATEALDSAVEDGAAPGEEIFGQSSAPDDQSTGVLELQDVTYLGGFPGEPKKRKHCTATLSLEAVEVNGPSSVSMRLAWDAIRSVEAQNSDEARFRTNTKIHRDSSALVFECVDGSIAMLEARQCPTIPLRQAIDTLLRGVDVAVK